MPENNKDKIPLNEFEESVLSYLREKHVNLDLTYFDLVTYVKKCLDNQTSCCPLEHGAECVGFESESGDQDAKCTCSDCLHFGEMCSFCNMYKFDLGKFHEDIKTMLDIT